MSGRLKPPLSGNSDGGFSFDAATWFGGLIKTIVSHGRQRRIEYMGAYYPIAARLVVEKLRKR